MSNLLDKCCECGQDFYSNDHLADCSREENIDMCGICDHFYHNQGKPIANQCLCESEGDDVETVSWSSSNPTGERANK
jgi:hypothetical protein